LTLCREFPIQPIRDEIGEALTFAKATAMLRQKPAELERMMVAVRAGDAKAWSAVLIELKLQPYCIQLCHWICGLVCHEFCVLVCPPIFLHPWFTHVGDFSITADIDPGSGLTNKAEAGHGGPKYGFFNCLSLRGFCPKRDPAHPTEHMAYRFLFQPAGAAQPTPITPGLVSEVLVGTRHCFWNGNPNTLQTVRIRGFGATPTPPTPSADLTPPDHYIVPDDHGWVDVDQDALDDAFSGYLMGFSSSLGVVPNGAAPTSVDAGTEVPVGDQKNGVDCAIIFQATRLSTKIAVNGGAAPDYTNQIGKVHINNWDQVAKLNLLQFHVPGATPCSPLSTDLDIEYTVDHELIAGWNITLTTAAPGVSLTSPPPPPSTARGGFGVHHEDISGWPTCSYTVKLLTRRRLTTGLTDDPTAEKPMTFCIGRNMKLKPIP